MKYIAFTFALLLTVSAFATQPVYPDAVEHLLELNLKMRDISIGDKEFSDIRASLSYCINSDAGKVVCKRLATGAVKEVGAQEIKNAIVKYNPEGKLEHYLKVRLHASSLFASRTGQIDFGFDDPFLFSTHALTIEKRSAYSFILTTYEDPRTRATLTLSATFQE